MIWIGFLFTIFTKSRSTLIFVLFINVCSLFTCNYYKELGALTFTAPPSKLIDSFFKVHITSYLLSALDKAGINIWNCEFLIISQMCWSGWLFSFCDIVIRTKITQIKCYAPATRYYIKINVCGKTFHNFAESFIRS